jgi:hypothetical protein
LKNALERTKFNDEEADVAPKVFGFAALGVMATMFALMGFSMTIIIFLVLVGYFVWRAVARTEIGEIRGIFEFYLSANEILRDDERCWYGFEINKVIADGQRILRFMPDPPPLIHFTLGALNYRAGNFQQAETHLKFLLEDERADERNLLTASSELKSYVRILRKLEREPAEAPQTTAAIRALERGRRHRAAALLSESRQKLKEALAAAKLKELPQISLSEPVKPLLERLEEPSAQLEASDSKKPENSHIKLPKSDAIKRPSTDAPFQQTNGNGNALIDSEKSNLDSEKRSEDNQPSKNQSKSTDKSTDKKQPQRPPISELLRDIYD